MTEEELIFPSDDRILIVAQAIANGKGDLSYFVDHFKLYT